MLWCSQSIGAQQGIASSSTCLGECLGDGHRGLLFLRWTLIYRCKPCLEVGKPYKRSLKSAVTLPSRAWWFRSQELWQYLAAKIRSKHFWFLGLSAILPLGKLVAVFSSKIDESLPLYPLQFLLPRFRGAYCPTCPSQQKLQIVNPLRSSQSGKSATLISLLFLSITSAELALLIVESVLYFNWSSNAFLALVFITLQVFYRFCKNWLGSAWLFIVLAITPHRLASMVSSPRQGNFRVQIPLISPALPLLMGKTGEEGIQS